MMISISPGNSKMGKVPSISLTPIAACPAGVPCATACYARKAYRQYPDTRAAYDGNFEIAKADPAGFFAQLGEWFDRKRKAPRLFRLHVAGDFFGMDYARAAFAFAASRPETIFLAFTKAHGLINGLIGEIGKPENMTIIFSAWPGMAMDNPHGLPIAWMQDGNENRIPADAIECHGRCETCGMCWQLPRIGLDVVFNAH